MIIFLITKTQSQKINNKIGDYTKILFSHNLCIFPSFNFHVYINMNNVNINKINNYYNNNYNIINN